jgi:hypothetical protein
VGLENYAALAAVSKAAAAVEKARAEAAVDQEEAHHAMLLGDMEMEMADGLAADAGQEEEGWGDREGGDGGAGIVRGEGREQGVESSRVRRVQFQRRRMTQLVAHTIIPAFDKKAKTKVVQLILTARRISSGMRGRFLILFRTHAQEWFYEGKQFPRQSTAKSGLVNHHEIHPP